MSSIPLPALGIKPPQQLDVAGALERGQQLQNSVLANQVGQQRLQQEQIQTQQMQAQQQRDAQIQQILQSEPDPNKAVMQIMKVDPVKGFQMRKAQQEYQNADTEGKTKILDNHIKNFQVLGQLAATVKDEPSKMAAIQQAVDAGALQPDEAQRLAQQPFTPDLPQQWQQQAMTSQQQLQEKRAQIEQDQKTREFNAKLPGEIADSEQKQKVNAGTSPTGITAEQQAQLNFQRQKEARSQANESKGTWAIDEDAKGNPVLFNSKTGETKPAPPDLFPKGHGKLTPREQDRSDLAANMSENLNQLEDIVNRRPELFGPAAGRLTQARQWLGTSDPDVAALKALHEYFGQASQGAHGMRSAQHVGKAADAVFASFVNSPDAVKGAIKVSRNSLGTFLKTPDNGGDSAPSQGGSDPFAAFGGKSR